MRCLFFGFYLTLYKLISLAISFLFVRLLLAPPCLVLLNKSFGYTLFACYLYLLFCSQNRNHTPHSSCKRRALTHNLSVCHGTQECGSLLVACSFSSVCCVLALQRSWLVPPGTPSIRARPFHFAALPHSTQSRQNPPPAQPSTHFCRQTPKSTQNREDWICFAQKMETFVFLFSLPLLRLWFHPMCLMALFCAVFLHPVVYFICSRITGYLSPPLPLFLLSASPLITPLDGGRMFVCSEGPETLWSPCSYLKSWFEEECWGCLLYSAWSAAWSSLHPLTGRFTQALEVAPKIIHGAYFVCELVKRSAVPLSASSRWTDKII